MRNHPWVVAVLSALLAAPASARVVFTGYADFRVIPQSDSYITGSDALLTSLGGAKRRTETRTFNDDSIGLFTTTSFNEQVDFLMDITYRRVGTIVRETRLQYAYVHYHSADLWEVSAGRVTLPIGWYNQNNFYPFQRNTVTPPLFQSSIIGLPIADHGVVASKTFDAGAVGLFGAVYVVNGYGPTRLAGGQASSDTFRGGLGATDALLIANNLRETDANSKFAYGCNFRVMFPRERNVKLGVSTYQGAWSPDGKSDFKMLNAYLTVDAGPLSLITEGLRTDTDNDRGVLAFFGARDWKSTGGFLEANWRLMKKDEREWTLFAGTEETVSQGKGAFAMGRERLTQVKGGLSWRMNQYALFKVELSQVNYTLPIVFGGGTQSLGIRQRQAISSLTLTY